MFGIDPVIRGPLLAATFMAAASAMLGCIVVCKRQSFIGETLSHASYPGLVVGAILAQIWLPLGGTLIPYIGALGSAVFSMYCVGILSTRFRVAEDSAQSAVLASMVAFGVFFISAVQSIFPHLARNMQTLLVGQASTMTDAYVCVSGALCIAVLIFVICLYRGYTAFLFDKEYAQLASLSEEKTQTIFSALLVACIMIGLRSMGVVLMTALLVFPAVCARLLARSFASMIAVSAILGAVSGIVGVALAHTCCLLSEGRALWMPTGPLITLILGGIFCVVLLFSPHTGLIIQAVRRWRFSQRCLFENALKIMWKYVQESHSPQLMKKQLLEACSIHKMRLEILLRRLASKGYIVVDKDTFVVTQEGLRVGQKLVRLHRLWELYLVECCKIPKDKVHPTADEMEHIFSEELERQLTNLLNNPKTDPHDRPIPKTEEAVL